MPTRTHICNLSLSEIGEQTITDISDGTKKANDCKLIFDDVVDEVAASEYWSKLKSRVELARLPDPPLYEFNFQFQLPSDSLQVVSVNDIDIGEFRYQIEDNKLLIDHSNVKIKYIKKQSNPELWGTFLQRAVVLRLAAGLAFKFTGDKALSESLYSFYDKYSRRATANDSNQGSRRFIRSTRLLRVR